MSYLVIARKYRPQKFDEIIGQQHISRTLKNAIKLDKISHSYLFTGPRGVGKTTAARIMAKAINCKDRKNEEPCNICVICKEITNSSNVDIIEIDAASNRGIDEIRRLRENVKFAPASLTYKVYIIDEVHMLTKEAFNAILKTLEEPPSHVIFIMATTEPEKILETIISRCQTFNFKLISEKNIKDNLQEIAGKETAEYEEEGLWMIARAAKGSMRDAQSIMDQVLSYSDGSIIASEIIDILGLIPRQYLFSYTEYFKTNNIKEALELTEKLIQEGYNLNRLFNELLLHFRNLMFAEVFGKASSFMRFSEEYSINLFNASKGFTRERLIWIIEFLSSSFQRMKYAENPHIVMDTILFKLCQKYVGYDDILNLVNKTADSDKNPNPISLSHKVETVPIQKEFNESAPTTKIKPSKDGKWTTILSLIKNDSQLLYHMLKEAETNLVDKKIIITYNTPLKLNDKHRQTIKNKIKEVMGDDFYPDIRKIKKNSIEKKQAEIAAVQQVRPLFSPQMIEEKEPIISEIVEKFKGKIDSLSEELPERKK